jgi:hypothetical protein
MDFVNSLSGANIVFAATHGEPSRFYAGQEFYDGEGTEFATHVYPYGYDRYDIVGHPTWLEGVGVEPYRSPQIGSGYPPYNSTGNPPLNLAFIMSCATGAEQDFIRFCLPYYNAYGGYLEDQAFVGYTPSIYIRDMASMATAFWGMLSAGRILREARSAVLELNLNPVGRSSPYNETDIPIYGDRYLRIESVYTGDDREPVGWYRSL